MFKLLVFLAGLTGGAAGAASWLLSEPAEGSSDGKPVGIAEERLDVLKRRFQAAVAEGQRAGAETEQRLRNRLDAYRNRPA